jgi:hypothetical protein
MLRKWRAAGVWIILIFSIWIYLHIWGELTYFINVIHNILSLFWYRHLLKSLKFKITRFIVIAFFWVRWFYWLNNLFGLQLLFDIYHFLIFGFILIFKWFEWIIQRRRINWRKPYWLSTFWWYKNTIFTRKNHTWKPIFPISQINKFVTHILIQFFLFLFILIISIIFCSDFLVDCMIIFLQQWIKHYVILNVFINFDFFIWNGREILLLILIAILKHFIHYITSSFLCFALLTLPIAYSCQFILIQFICWI